MNEVLNFLDEALSCLKGVQIPNDVKIEFINRLSDFIADLDEATEMYDECECEVDEDSDEY